MTQKHTLGPWVVDQLDGNVYGASHVCVAIPHGPAGERKNIQDEHDANARLIAAAPELKEALSAITTFLAREQARYPKSVADMPAIEDQLIAKGQAAIEKAEGRE